MTIWYGKAEGNQNSMNMDRMNTQQESKQQPMDKQNQTWARQILSIINLNTVLVMSTIVLHFWK